MNGVAQSRGATYPWDGHVRHIVELPDRAIRGFVRRDQQLWEEAREDPDLTAYKAVRERIFFRNGAPRLGEPLFRPGTIQAQVGSPGMTCGRGTGHLGSGLYFFGTLRAAARGTGYRESDAQDVEHLRRVLQGVYVVDMGHVPEDQIYVTYKREKTGKLHAFAKALICWPDEAGKFEESAHREALLERRADELREDSEDETDAEWEERQDAIFETGQELKRVTEQKRGAESRMKQLRMTLEWDGLRWDPSNEPPRARSIEDLLRATQIRPPVSSERAIEPYLRDISERREPGFHPMTYYMRQHGYQAVLHATWGEFNSGDIGNIWYPGGEP